MTLIRKSIKNVIEMVKEYAELWCMLFYLVTDEGQHTWTRSCHTPVHLHTHNIIRNNGQTFSFHLAAFKNIFHPGLKLLLVFISTDKAKWWRLLIFIYEETIIAKTWDTFVSKIWTNKKIIIMSNSYQRCPGYLWWEQTCWGRTE